MATVFKDALFKRLENLPNLNKKFNMFNHLRKMNQIDLDVQSDGPLSGMLMGTKDNIVTKEMPTTCSSDILANYVSPYDATVVKLLQNAGVVNVGKTNMDEFGMGSGGVYSAHGPVLNPIYGKENRVAGGSSSGSAAAVACGAVDFALGTDTGGSVRLPAAYCSVTGFKPSYGRVSRYGVIAYAQSLDTVGILSKDVQTIEKVFEAVDKHDTKDPTSLSDHYRSLLKKESFPRYTYGLVEQFNQQCLSATSQNALLTVLEKLFDYKNTIKPVSIPLIENCLPAYYTLAPSEAVSNLARYDGIRYGHQDPSTDFKDGTLFAGTRSAFGSVVKNRLILGNYNLCSESFKNNYIKAQKIRVKLIDEFDAVFSTNNCLSSNKNNENGVDLLLSLTALDVAPTLSEFSTKSQQNPINAYINDVFTVPISMAGLPAISIPVPKTGLSLQIAGQYGDDYKVLAAAKQLEALLNK
ncbi:hypothetical protein ACO0RG_002285 [Hanseniaspora osmophila]|uniref:Glutamyl-tRNA(Gln) amidotransferase subunit A, mitochondrial n=1 Tax=Hanseniaspora osmophila TaxID=56408 RepID=A0A1E5RIS3_9ASCO|nr:Glutamyl-tRNA(Gln) amidotransferase subunit A, mitochondrial [Hanseniaspora osmophila]